MAGVQHRHRPFLLASVVVHQVHVYRLAVLEPKYHAPVARRPDSNKGPDLGRPETNRILGPLRGDTKPYPQMIDQLDTRNSTIIGRVPFLIGADS